MSSSVPSLQSSVKNGAFQRAGSVFRSWITKTGEAGSSGAGGFRAQPGRYHLYVSLACPWAHRTLIVRELKGLQPLIGVSVVNFLMPSTGWNFNAGPGVVPDSVNHVQDLRELYELAQPRYEGRVTVPVVWDKETRTIVNNESSEIIRMFNTAFDELPGVNASLDLYPAALREDIDAINDRVYNTLNNGVYKAGFATTQEAYEAAVLPLFDTLEWLDQRLATHRYLAGAALTEADVRLYTTLIRFDHVYHGHFKCNIKKLSEFPNLSAYLRELYQMPAFKSTTNFEHIKNHYYMSHKHVNPTGVVAIGPDIKLFDLPHNRARIGESTTASVTTPHSVKSE